MKRFSTKFAVILARQSEQPKKRDEEEKERKPRSTTASQLRLQRDPWPSLSSICADRIDMTKLNAVKLSAQEGLAVDLKNM
jgi:hypothetical protein